MKLGVTAENPLERVVLALGLAPVTLMDTQMSFIRARAIMVGTRLGIFESLAGAPLAAGEAGAGSRGRARSGSQNARSCGGHNPPRRGRGARIFVCFALPPLPAAQRRRPRPSRSGASGRPHSC